VKKEPNNTDYWCICEKCKGLGQLNKRLRKKIRLAYKNALEEYQKNNKTGPTPEKPSPVFEKCQACNGSGLIKTQTAPVTDTEKYPHIAIVGAGIGGVALGVACLHRGIPFTLFEKDAHFSARSQGYGLTLQQASKALKAFGILSLEESVVSTRHLVHNTSGEVIGEWGMRKWQEERSKKPLRHNNIHISRQSLRKSLLEQLHEENKPLWDHELIDIKEDEEKMVLHFKVQGELKKYYTDLVVGADGIRSAVRNWSIGAQISPLNYLDCMVILGICSSDLIQGVAPDLLDGKTVFQTANGAERIYVMPYDKNAVMWQLSFPINEDTAKKLRALGPKKLKEIARERTQWHSPIPEIIAATELEKISGYPVYDRAVLDPKILEKHEKISLIGDAAHPMSPFKGQGANQALLDALSLARSITKGCHAHSEWQKNGIRETVLKAYETEMLERSAVKVKDSAAAAQFLHSEEVLHESNAPRGAHLKK
jgi:2-polyprenyl-6-methoxyphenol hydroxylase-like FAD-dependent oxidoreductase